MTLSGVWATERANYFAEREFKNGLKYPVSWEMNLTPWASV